MSQVRYDKEVEEFRRLMEVPSTFEDGFSWTALAGALFVALLMVPGAMYMQLLAGFGVGPAAQWVTVVLFIEVARRAHKHLRRPEIFVLFYMAGAVMMLPQSGLLWNQFFVQSRAATGSGVAERMSDCWWVAPTDPEILAKRSFFNPAWYPALGMMVFGTLMGRLNSSVLSYGLFRIASDIEKLPFPMAPIGAQGIMALAEQQSEEGGRADPNEGWRWRIFSIGGVLGLSFGALYMALPAISSAVLDKPITIFPIPFVDWTEKTSGILPAVATGLTLDLGQLVTGMVLPFFAMLGSFLGLVICTVANPIMYRAGLLPSWDVGDDTVKTLFKNNIDFYFSFSVGLAIAIAIVGIWQIQRSLRARSRQRRQQQDIRLDMEKDRPIAPPDRGDIRARWVILTYLFTSTLYILVSGWLIEWHPGVMLVLLFFAFIYTPLISYVTARLEGMAGQVVEIPMVREAAFILSGYSGGVKVWFLPVPMANYGQGTVFWRQAELTGTRFWSIWKAEILLVPIVLVSGILFAQFIWSLAPIPGPEYPYTERMWEFNAANQCIILTSTLGRFSQFQEAINGWHILAGGVFGLLLFSIMFLLHMPVMLTYGLVRGLNQTIPHVVLPQFIGALIGRYYFQRRMGLKWRQYVPVVAAGFSCGMGLITVLAVGVNFLAKAVIKIPF